MGWVDIAAFLFSVWIILAFALSIGIIIAVIWGFITGRIGF